MEEVPEPVFERETILKVSLPCEEAEAIRTLAKSKGVGDGELIREWILEKIHAS